MENDISKRSRYFGKYLIAGELNGRPKWEFLTIEEITNRFDISKVVLMWCITQKKKIPGTDIIPLRLDVKHLV